MLPNLSALPTGARPGPRAPRNESQVQRRVRRRIALKPREVSILKTAFGRGEIFAYMSNNCSAWSSRTFYGLTTCGPIRLLGYIRVPGWCRPLLRARMIGWVSTPTTIEEITELRELLAVRAPAELYGIDGLKELLKHQTDGRYTVPFKATQNYIAKKKEYRLSDNSQRAWEQWLGHSSVGLILEHKLQKDPATGLLVPVPSPPYGVMLGLQRDNAAVADRIEGCGGRWDSIIIEMDDFVAHAQNPKFSLNFMAIADSEARGSPLRGNLLKELERVTSVVGDRGYPATAGAYEEMLEDMQDAAALQALQTALDQVTLEQEDAGDEVYEAQYYY